MTLEERRQLALRAKARRATARAEALHRELEQDGCIKRAAHKVGIPYRTACRYRAERFA